jgi:hypothetical protein
MAFLEAWAAGKEAMKKRKEKAPPWRRTVTEAPTWSDHFIGVLAAIQPVVIEDPKELVRQAMAIHEQARAHYFARKAARRPNRGMWNKAKRAARKKKP